MSRNNKAGKFVAS